MTWITGQDDSSELLCVYKSLQNVNKTCFLGHLAGLSFIVDVKEIDGRLPIGLDSRYCCRLQNYNLRIVDHW